MEPRIGYVDVGGASVGHLVVDGTRGGDVDVVLVTPNLTVPMSMWSRDPVMARFVHGLADLGRLVLFDRRGIGISDGLDPEMSIRRQWADDLVAVVRATCTRPVVVVCTGFCEAAVLAAVDAPELFRDLVLVAPFPTWSPELAELASYSEGLAQRAVVPGNDGSDLLAFTMPTRAADPEFRRWFEDAGRLGASPRVAARIFAGIPGDEAQELASTHRALTTPTLVLQRPDAVARVGAPSGVLDIVHAAYPGAVRRDVPGVDWLPLGDGLDAVLAEIQRHVVGAVRLPEPTRRLRCVVFSDIVDSTLRARELGDAMWRTLLARHDELGRTVVEQHGGTFVKSTGDGMLATFASAHDAVTAAVRLREELQPLELGVRLGIHLGDVEHHGDDVSGLTVVAAARIMALGESGEILVSDTVRTALVGQSVATTPRGTHELKGVPDPWPIHTVDSPTA